MLARSLLALRYEEKWSNLSSNLECSPKIWLAKVGDEHDSLEHQVLEQLSSSELERLQSIKSKPKRHEYLLSRALMRHALSEQFSLNQQDWIFVDKAHTPPRIENLPNGYWLSLSHSHGTICFVLHKEPIGIDIEQSRSRENFMALSRSFMNKNELDLLNSNNSLIADNFYKIWCAKEAFYKMIPPADQDGLFMKKINYFDLTKGKINHLIQGNIEGCHLALVTKASLKNIGALQARTFNGSIKIKWA